MSVLVSGRSNIGINWQSVFPLPVPAVIMVSLPWRIAMEAWIWNMHGTTVHDVRWY
jgi:hypothetical protein